MHVHGVVLVMLLANLAVAQKPSSQSAAKTWMDLEVGTDLTWRAEGADVGEVAGGKSESGNATREIRILCLGLDDDGKLRIAMIDEALPKEPHDVPIVNAEIAVLDPETSELQRQPGGGGGPMQWSPLMAFPFPALTPAEWKAKKPVTKSTVAPIGGEPQELSLTFSFDKVKVGRKKVPVLVGAIDPGQPVAIRLVGIAGMVAMAEGRMPKLGASGVDPVEAMVTELRREYRLDAKGRLCEIHTTNKYEAAGGKIKLEGQHTMRETDRRKLAAKDLAAFTTLVEEICAIANGRESRPERRQRAEALQSDAKKLGLGPTVDRLVDSLTRDGLPPGLGR
ncbi:MAG: hypothetical protein KDC98_01925 [Planctomycetes bacterium]|nr:hypothetical protein [Planctomycetota bacterium]